MTSILLSMSDIQLGLIGTLILFLGDLDLLERAPALPPILQHVRPQDLALLHALDQRHVDRVQVHVILPVLVQPIDDLHRLCTRSRDDFRIVVTVEEGIRQRDGLDAADGRLHRTAYRARAQTKHGGRVPAVVWTRHDEIDGTSLLEVVVQANLHAAGGRAVDEDPFLISAAVRQRLGGGDAAVIEGVGRVPSQGTRAEVGWFHSLADDVGFADPGALRVREADGDGVACRLEAGDERVDVRGGLVRGRPIVVCYLVGE